MYIIFGDSLKDMPNNYTLLELDTIKFMPEQKLISTWCVIEKVSLEDFPVLESRKKIHADLIEQYRLRNWDFCIKAIEKLLGCWNNELDTFYIELGKRIGELMQSPPGDNWDGALVRSSPTA
jgi:hypothetical protein